MQENQVGDFGPDVPAAKTEEEAERCGLSDAELKDPGRAMTSAGVMKMWQTMRAKGLRLQREQRAAEAELKAALMKLFEEECKTIGREAAQERLEDRLADARVRTEPPEPEAPPWAQVMGLEHPWEERELSPNERARRVRKLLNAVEKMVRHELRSAQLNHRDTETQRNTEKGKGLGDRNEGLGDGGENDERGMMNDEDCVAGRRSYRWDPMRAVCFHLGIAVRKVSAYSKELNGMAAGELVDCIKAEEVRKKLKREMREEVRAYFTAKAMEKTETRNPKFEGNGETEKGEACAGRVPGRGSEQAANERPLSADSGTKLAAEIWRWVKAKRRGPTWHRECFAAGLGFSSYACLFRGCMLCWEKAVQQMEVEAIEEVLREGEREDHHRDTETQRNTENGEGGKVGEAVREEVAAGSA
jgi:hypothetical protein